MRLQAVSETASSKFVAFHSGLMLKIAAALVPARLGGATELCCHNANPALGKEVGGNRTATDPCARVSRRPDRASWTDPGVLDR